VALAGLALPGCTTADQAAVDRAPRIADTAFEAAARTDCKQTAHIFDTATTLPSLASSQQSADLLDQIDATFDALVVRLRQIPVTAADQPATAGWLADWDAYVAFGHTYAAAVRNGTDGTLSRGPAAAREGEIRRRRNAFAQANRMQACVFP
jgi:hypothetical protein